MKNVIKTLSVILICFGMVSCGVPEVLQPAETSLITPSSTTISESPSEDDFEVSLNEETFTNDSDSPPYEIDAAWPILSGPEEVTKPYNERVNNLVQETQDNFLESVRDRYLQDEGGQERPKSTLDISYEVTLQKYGLLSIYLEITQYIAIAAHPATYSHAINYNINSGSFIDLEDLFLAGSDPVTSLAGRITEDINQRGFEVDTGLIEGIMREDEKWNLLSEGLRINFDAYQVAPGAAGPQFVLLPWGGLVSELDPDGPLGPILE